MPTPHPDSAWSRSSRTQRVVIVAIVVLAIAASITLTATGHPTLGAGTLGLAGMILGLTAMANARRNG